jgi:hypothetical protein
MNRTSHDGESDGASEKGESGWMDRWISRCVVAFVLSMALLSGGLWAANRYLGWEPPPSVKSILNWIQ